MSGFSFRLMTLPAKFGCGSAASIDRRSGASRKNRPGGLTDTTAALLPHADYPCRFNGLWPRRKPRDEEGPVFRGVSLRIGWKSPSCRDGSATWHFDREVADMLTPAGWNGEQCRIGAVVRLRRAKAVVSVARTLPNLGGISDTCSSPPRFFLIIPIFSS